MSMMLMCLKFFFARILDVTLGTVRTFITVKGKTLLAAIIAFIEVTIWFLVAKEALRTETNFFVVVSYASGYAVGTMLGTFISKNFVKGLIRVEAITTEATDKNIDLIKNAGYGLSIIELKSKDKVKQDLLLIEAKNNQLKKITNLIKSIDENAFIVINDTKIVYNGFIK